MGEPYGYMYMTPDLEKDKFYCIEGCEKEVSEKNRRCRSCASKRTAMLYHPKGINYMKGTN